MLPSGHTKHHRNKHEAVAGIVMKGKKHGQEMIRL